MDLVVRRGKTRPYKLVIVLFATICLITSIIVDQSRAEVPRIILTVADTALYPGQDGTCINVYLDNFVDTIAGFQFQLRSERPDLVTFNFEHGGFDTSGTLVSGFEYVEVRDTSVTEELLWFRCIADLPFDTNITHGIIPQQGGPAVRIPVNTTATPDTSGSLTSVLTIVKPFDFSDPWGNSIGVVTDTLTDTIYYLCTEWQEDSCHTWEMVNPDSSDYDSVHVYDYLYGWLDTTVVVPNHGSVTLLAPDQTFCDNDGDGQITVIDLSCLVDYLFRGHPDAEACPYVTYCRSEELGMPGVDMLTELVDFLFRGGPLPSP